MIYIIDNGGEYSDHSIYFVEAPDDFGEWWRTVMRPWIDEQNRQEWVRGETQGPLGRPLRMAQMRPIPAGYVECGHKLVASAPEIHWYEGEPMPVNEYMIFHNTYRKNVTRPRYRTESP